MITEARVTDGAEGGAPISLAEIERSDGELKQLGVKLSEGRDLLSSRQYRRDGTERLGFRGRLRYKSDTAARFHAGLNRK